MNRTTHVKLKCECGKMVQVGKVCKCGRKMPYPRPRSKEDNQFIRSVLRDE